MVERWYKRAAPIGARQSALTCFLPGQWCLQRFFPRFLGHLRIFYYGRGCQSFQILKELTVEVCDRWEFLSLPDSRVARLTTQKLASLCINFLPYFEVNLRPSFIPANFYLSDLRSWRGKPFFTQILRHFHEPPV